MVWTTLCTGNVKVNENPSQSVCMLLNSQVTSTGNLGTSSTSDVHVRSTCTHTDSLPWGFWRSWNVWCPVSYWSDDGEDRRHLVRDGDVSSVCVDETQTGTPTVHMQCLISSLTACSRSTPAGDASSPPTCRCSTYWSFDVTSASLWLLTQPAD